MALSNPSKVTSGADNTSGTDVTTASVTPTGDAKVFLWVLAHDDSDAPEDPSSFGGTGWANGLSWSQVGSSVTIAYSDGTGTGKASLWAATVPSSPSAGTVTMNFTSTHEGFAWYLIEWTGAETPSVVSGQTATGSANGSHSISLPSAVTAGNMVGVFATVAENSTPLNDLEVEFTKLAKQDPAVTEPQYAPNAAYDPSNESQSATVGNSNTASDETGGIIFEVQEGSGAAPTSWVRVNKTSDIAE